jgi:hypothetical protein
MRVILWEEERAYLRYASQLLRDSVYKAHDSALRRVGINDHFRLCDLQHTYGTRAAEAGVDLATLASLMGHTKIQMAMRYLYPADQHKQEAAKKLEALKQARLSREQASLPASWESAPNAAVTSLQRGPARSARTIQFRARPVKKKVQGRLGK